MEKENTLQSIDSTLKRIEAILLDCYKANQRSPLDTLRGAVAASISEMKASQEE